MVDSKRFLLRGIGNRADEIAARFFGRLALRGVKDMRWAAGTLTLKGDNGIEDTRPYYFIERDLSNDGALTIVTVQLASVGDGHGDLFVEWSHYNIPGMEDDNSPLRCAVTVIAVVTFIAAIFMTIVTNSGAAFWITIFLGVVIAVVAMFNITPGRSRKQYLVGFQSQDSIAFQGAVRAALEEAIDHAGIDKAGIQGFGNDGDGPRRII
ncbi:MAG: hypothetical protein NTZ05_21135 [Chloroflexi bacterium]|nr:hypothetical protein [Chloroflexota bacterium]